MVKKITLRTLWTLLIPNQHIGGGTGGQGADPHNIPQKIHSNGDLPTILTTLGVEQHIAQGTSHASNWHGINHVCYTIRKMGAVVKGVQLVTPIDFIHDKIQMRTDLVNTVPKKFSGQCGAGHSPIVQLYVPALCYWHVFMVPIHARRAHGAECSL